MSSSVPPEGTPVPPVVSLIAGGRPVRGVWCNELGGSTWQLGDGLSREFVKWAPQGTAVDLFGESERMRWARSFTPVPRVIDVGANDHGRWLHTAGLPGENAVADRWKAEPATAVRAIGEGLRAFHDALPVEECPFQWSVQDRLDEARQRAGDGLMDPAIWHSEHRHLGVEGALAILADAPPVEQLVVCHGDTCAPNTLVGEDGQWSGHVDLGALGVADRWADLAIATWSTQWNYGAGWEAPLLEWYGIDPDPDRTRYYRLLWDLGP